MFGGFLLIVLRRVSDPTYSSALTVEDEDDKMHFGERWFLPRRGNRVRPGVLTPGLVVHWMRPESGARSVRHAALAHQIDIPPHCGATFRALDLMMPNPGVKTPG